MRVTLKIDSASSDEAREFILAFQRTDDQNTLSYQLEPTVSIMGVGWGVETPPMNPERASAMMALLIEEAK